MNDKKKAVLLLSGGIDSYTCLAMARTSYSLYIISFNYNQSHKLELEAAKKIAESMGVEKHIIIDIDLSKFGGSALTDDIALPKDIPIGEIGKEIPVSYVPARNTIFLSLALGWAEVLGAEAIFIGANAVDYSGYPDCRPEFIEAFEKMANLATKTGVEGNKIEIKTPLINLSKSEIITKGIELDLDYSLTLSCYEPDENSLACGRCDSCRLRHKGFADAGIDDPTNYSHPVVL